MPTAYTCRKWKCGRCSQVIRKAIKSVVHEIYFIKNRMPTTIISVRRNVTKSTYYYHQYSISLLIVRSLVHEIYFIDNIACSSKTRTS